MMEIEPHLRPYYLIAGVLVISGILFLAAGGSNRHGPYIDELMSEAQRPDASGCLRSFMSVILLIMLGATVFFFSTWIAFRDIAQFSIAMVCLVVLVALSVLLHGWETKLILDDGGKVGNRHGGIISSSLAMFCLILVIAVVIWSLG